MTELKKTTPSSSVAGPPATEKEYLVFCDESDASGRFYSNFYGGVLVGALPALAFRRGGSAIPAGIDEIMKEKWPHPTYMNL